MEAEVVSVTLDQRLEVRYSADGEDYQKFVHMSHEDIHFHCGDVGMASRHRSSMTEREAFGTAYSRGTEFGSISHVSERDPGMFAPHLSVTCSPSLSFSYAGGDTTTTTTNHYRGGRLPLPINGNTQEGGKSIVNDCTRDMYKIVRQRQKGDSCVTRFVNWEDASCVWENIKKKSQVAVLYQRHNGLAGRWFQRDECCGPRWSQCFRAVGYMDRLEDTHNKDITPHAAKPDIEPMFYTPPGSEA